MSQRNIDAIRPVYEEWRHGNFEPVFDVYDPEMEWGWSDEFPGLAGVYRDPGVRNARLREWLGPWERWRVEAEEFVVNGDWVVAMCRYTGRGKWSGLDVESLGAHVWKLRDSKAIRLEIFSDRQKALAAAGIG